MDNNDSTIPESIFSISEDDICEKILELKKTYGPEMVILGHHYQRKNIVNLSDFKGDSLELARTASKQEEAKHIVFCGVNFMAESAAILCQDTQLVLHPDTSAGCPMADMAKLSQVQNAYNSITSITCPDSLIPITYMNSSAEIKSFCGERGGAICTSSNAAAVMKWALNEGKRVLFLPDENLGRNTSNLLKIPRNEVAIWNPEEQTYSETELETAKVILWKGYCHVHTHFTVEHIKKARAKFPEGKIIIHPECPEEVADVSDAQGSTSQIENYVKKAPPASTIIIGTEINFVSRLADENPDQKIYDLSRSLCTNMYKITPHNLYHTILNPGKINVIKVPENIKEGSRIALKKMLEILS